MLFVGSPTTKELYDNDLNLYQLFLYLIRIGYNYYDECNDDQIIVKNIFTDLQFTVIKFDKNIIEPKYIDLNIDILYYRNKNRILSYNPSELEINFISVSSENIHVEYL